MFLQSNNHHYSEFFWFHIFPWYVRNSSRYKIRDMYIIIYINSILYIYICLLIDIKIQEERHEDVFNTATKNALF